MEVSDGDWSPKDHRMKACAPDAQRPKYTDPETTPLRLQELLYCCAIGSSSATPLRGLREAPHSPHSPLGAWQKEPRGDSGEMGVQAGD